jgi:rhodanese-related sulfurtransferase
MPVPGKPSAREAQVSLVLQVPGAEPADAESHFLNRLAVETDPSDVHADLGKGVAGFLVVDCRGPDAYAAGHVPGALSVPYRTIAQRAATVPRDKLLVLYCTGPHCNASTKAAVQWAALGYRVKEMIGGLWGWQQEGYPLETGAAKVPPTLARI